MFTLQEFLTTFSFRYDFLLSFLKKFIVVRALNMRSVLLTDFEYGIQSH